MSSAANKPWACCTIPLVRGPIAIRRPRRSENDRIGESARAMKNNGPAFIGAAMARPMGCWEGGVAVFGAADPVRGHKTEFDFAGVQPIGVFDAGGARFQNFDGAQCGASLQQRLEHTALCIECAVALGSTDSNHHEIVSWCFAVAGARCLPRWRLSIPGPARWRASAARRMQA